MATWAWRWSTGTSGSAARPGERLGGREAHEQRADEPGALGDADASHVVEADARVVERGPNDRCDELEVASGGDLGHDAPVPRVQLRLRGDDRGEDLAVLGDDGGSGLVAGGFEPEDGHAAPPPSAAAGSSTAGSGSRHMMSASSRLSV